MSDLKAYQAIPTVKASAGLSEPVSTNRSFSIFVLGEYKSTSLSYMCFPAGSDGKESAYKVARPWFDL